MAPGTKRPRQTSRARPLRGGAAPVLDLRPRVTDAQLPDARDALRLVVAATEAARRLRPFCTDWSGERFGDAVHGSALARLRSELRPDDLSHLPRRFPAHREAYLERHAERAG